MAASYGDGCFLRCLLLLGQRLGIRNNLGLGLHGNIGAGGRIILNCHHLLHHISGSRILHQDRHLLQLGLHLDRRNRLLNRLRDGLNHLLHRLHHGLGCLLDCLNHGLNNLLGRLNHRLSCFLRRLHHRLGTTMIYVTHDQEEAFALSDRIMIMDKGEISQLDTPENICKNPANDYVKTFVLDNLAAKIKSLSKYAAGLDR